MVWFDVNISVTDLAVLVLEGRWVGEGGGGGVRRGVKQKSN